MKIIRILNRSKINYSILIIFVLLISVSFVKSSISTESSFDHVIDVVNEAIYIDSDGHKDGDEVRAGTDPLNPLLHPSLVIEWRLTIIISSSVLGLAGLITILFFVIKKRSVK